jgi:O-antigen ligase
VKRTSAAVNAGLFVIIILVPLAWTKLFNAEFTLAKLLTLNAALFLAAWGAALRPEALAAGETILDAPLLAGLAVLCLAAAASTDPATSLRGRYDSYAYGLWGFILVAASGQLAARSTRGSESFWVRWLTRSAAIVGSYAVLQKMGVDPIFHLKSLPTGGRAVSTLGSPVDLGALLVLIWPAALWSAESERGPVATSTAALVLAGLLASGSRGAILAAAMGAAVYYLMSRRKSARPLLLAGTLATLTVAAAIAWSFRPDASAVDAGRREVWRTAWAAFAQRPWLGWGFDGFEDAFRKLRTVNSVAIMGSTHRQAYPHNDFLHVLTGAGLVGVCVYGWLWVSFIRAARAAMERRLTSSLAAALTAGLLALWVNMALNPVALEVLVFAGIVVGILSSLSSGAATRFRTRAPFIAAGALATFSLVYCLRLAGADMSFKSGVKAQAAGDFSAAQLYFSRARAAVPCELAYVLGEVNALGDWINATHVVGERLSLLARADEAGRQARACHPNQVNAHYIAGAVARMRVALGFKDDLVVAAREYDTALALDPMFAPLLADRVALAQMAGDAEAVKRVSRELARVRALKVE